MKTELCWNRTKTAEGQVAGAWLAGKLTVQTPRRPTADTQVQHTNKAHALPALLIGTFEEEHASSRCCTFRSLSSAVILAGEMGQTQRSIKGEKQSNQMWAK